MRVSIWQQFSSNHSSSVTIVGRFVSPAAASEAAARLDTILKDVSAWWEKHYDPDAHSIEPFGGPPIPGEIELLRKYDLPTDESFNFTGDVRWSLSTTFFDRVVCVLIGETSKEPPHPVRHLIQQLGGQEVACGFESVTLINVQLTCTAPDSATAEAISANPWEGVESMGGTVQRDGVQLTFDMFFSSFEAGFPRFLNSLCAKDCTNITYSFTEADTGGVFRFSTFIELKHLLASIQAELDAAPVAKPVRVDLFCESLSEEYGQDVLARVTVPDKGLAFTWRGDAIPGEATREGNRLAFRNLQLDKPLEQLREIVKFLETFVCSDFSCRLVK